MPIDLLVLGGLRPFVFHSSDEVNFKAIRASRQLRSASTLLEGTAHEGLLHGRRMTTQIVHLPEGPISVRDHLPLRPGSVDLEPGCTLNQFIHLLNQRVFFWLGTLTGPNRRGRAHRESLDRGGSIFTLRVPFASLIAANPGNPPYVARCNSGSARHHSGSPVPRGPSTYRLLPDADFPAAEAVEFSFVGSVVLPTDTQFATSLNEPWQQL